MNLPSQISDNLTEVLNSEVQFIRPVGGGSIHHAAEIRAGSDRYFLKYNDVRAATMFRTEERGLRLLGNAVTRQGSDIYIPEVYYSGTTDDNQFAWLLMEFMEETRTSDSTSEALGHGLAKLHLESVIDHEGTFSGRETFGLPYDNFIGSLPQRNVALGDAAASWSEFFITMRLEPQFRMAFDEGKLSKDLVLRVTKLYDVIRSIIPQASPSLLHGDLWSGNYMSIRLPDPKAEKGMPDVVPAIFDPAVYFGHREVDLAFTHLFGGFSPSFYAAYNENNPLEPGFKDRIDIYNLYPLLVHVNLFGGSYFHQVRRIMDKFVGI